MFSVYKDLMTAQTALAKITTDGKLDLYCEVGENWVSLTLPIDTLSEAKGGRSKTIQRNGKKIQKAEGWRKAHGRHKRQQGWVKLMLQPKKSILKLPCLITLTRYAPRKLDKFDNLPMSMKWVLDALCAVITGDYRPGRADDTDEIDVKYKQVIWKEYGIHIVIEML